MAELLFICPRTKRQAPAGIETDVKTLRATWSETLKVRCPHRGGEHYVPVRETYINGALNDAFETVTSYHLAKSPRSRPPTRRSPGAGSTA
jgi:hypothetical protein